MQFILDEFSKLLIVGDEEFRGYAVANLSEFSRTKSPPAFCAICHRLRHHDWEAPVHPICERSSNERTGDALLRECLRGTFSVKGDASYHLTVGKQHFDREQFSTEFFLGLGECHVLFGFSGTTLDDPNKCGFYDSRLQLHSGPLRIPIHIRLPRSWSTWRILLTHSLHTPSTKPVFPPNFDRITSWETRFTIIRHRRRRSINLVVLGRPRKTMMVEQGAAVGWGFKS